MTLSDVPGHTATLAAVGRALHLSTAHQRLIEDHLALDLSGPAGAVLMAQLTAQTPTSSPSWPGPGWPGRGRRRRPGESRS